MSEKIDYQAWIVFLNNKGCNYHISTPSKLSEQSRDRFKLIA